MKFSKFMASPAGRLLRVVAGIALIAWGLYMQSIVGYVIAVVGLVPLLAGVFDKCVFAPLFKQPFDGKAIRNGKANQSDKNQPD